MSIPQVDAGSFRDPRGHIYHHNNRIIRTVSSAAIKDYEFVRRTGLITQLIQEKKLLDERVIDPAAFNFSDSNVTICLEHPRLPFISYPYEWTFSALKSAALLQLDILLMALKHDVILTDASAYNIQFQGACPVFIDHLAFRPYIAGEIWPGYQQFCEQFLNPLLMRSVVGLSHHAWMRGSPEGISASELKKILPGYSLLKPTIFLHVVLQAAFQKTSNKKAEKRLSKINFKKEALCHLIEKMRVSIVSLKPKSSGKTVWQDYAKNHETPSEKLELIAEFSQMKRPALVYDFGCNVGGQAKCALKNGAELVVGFENDEGALEAAFLEAEEQGINFFPVHMDLANPTPEQGWAQEERKGLMQRGTADAVFALALIHHLAISKNIPLNKIIHWLLNRAPSGLIEFVPKSDPMLQELLRLRTDIFEEYTLENFLNIISQRARIVKKIEMENGRVLVWYDH